MKQNIYVTHIKGEVFKAVWYDPELTAEQLKALGLSEAPGEIDIEGDFTVEWKDELPEPYVCGVFLLLPNGQQLAISEHQISFYDLQDQIYTYGDQLEWRQRLDEARADYEYQSWKDTYKYGS